MFKQENSSLTIQYQKEAKLNKELKTIILKLNNDDFWEIEARKKLGFIKKNEKVYKFLQSY